MVKRLGRLLLVSLGVAWLFDFLFWGKTPGISITIYIAICLTAGFLLARGEGLRPARRSLWLLLPIAFLAVMSAIRAEPMTVFLNVALGLFLMLLLARTFLGGHWLEYGLTDYIISPFSVLLSAAIRPFQAIAAKGKGENKPSLQSTSKKSFAVLRGLLLALPLLLLFSILLAAADPFFSDGLRKLVRFFFTENIGMQLFRGFYILILALLLSGIYLHVLLHSKDEELPSEQRSRFRLKPFLGITETAIVLGSITLLFGAFVVFQFKYFFGGQANVVPSGFTYAEYARQGFGELVFVAIFSLLLFQGLNSITQMEGRQRTLFSALGIALFGLVGVILVSAYQRLLLYEQAYGFTRLRTYTHVFMIWLGLLLLAMVILEVTKHQRAFALALLCAALGFVATLNFLNVDALITRQNIQSWNPLKSLDTDYLAGLSTDSMSTLVDLYQSTSGDDSFSKDLHRRVLEALACHALMHDEYITEYSWRSFNLSCHIARQQWLEVSRSPGFPQITQFEDWGKLWIEIDEGPAISCGQY